jgi:hypothetical protein
MALDLIVSAVVVGKDESLTGDQLPGATPSKQDDRILHGGLTGGINIFRFEQKTLCPHLIKQGLADQGWWPHAFFGKGRAGYKKQTKQESEGPKKNMHR